MISVARGLESGHYDHPSQTVCFTNLVIRVSWEEPGDWMHEMSYRDGFSNYSFR